MNAASRNTYELLKQIAKHSHSRPEFRKIEFEVVIDEHNKVTMSPRYEVFPSNKRRKKCDKQDIIFHILTEHLESPYFVAGRYVYKRKGNAANRRWWKYSNNPDR